MCNHPIILQRQYIRILISILIFLCTSTWHASAKNNPRSSEEILTECRKMFFDSYEMNTIEKRMQWLDAQKQADVFYDLILADDSVQTHTAAWQDYYIQLIRLFYYLDPSQPMSEYRAYMNDLQKLVTNLPPEYHLLKWYAYRKISQIYILEGKQQKAFTILESIVQDILPCDPMSRQDSINLILAMTGQLYCVKSIPTKLGRRNLRYMHNMRANPADIRVTLGKAIFQKNHHRVVTIADSLLANGEIRLMERFYLSKLSYESLRMTPPSRYNARRMLRLLALQDSLYADIQRARNTDYTAYKELQVQNRVQAEIVKKSRVQLVRFYHTGIILGLVAIILIILFWYNNRHESHFKLSILQRLTKEKQAQSTAFLEAKTAYANQVSLVRNLNHDLRIPLNALMGFSHILTSSDELTEEERQEAGRNIQQSNNQLQDMINNLLGIARVETNKMSLKCRSLQACDLLNPADWEELTAQLAPNHTLRVLPINTTRPLRTDDRHIRQIVELVVKYIVSHTETNNILVDSYISSLDKLYIEIQTGKKELSIPHIQHALDMSKSISDYEDANNYYLVLGRMLAQLIGAHLVLKDQVSDALHIQLIIPLPSSHDNQ